MPLSKSVIYECGRCGHQLFDKQSLITNAQPATPESLYFAGSMPNALRTHTNGTSGSLVTVVSCQNCQQEIGTLEAGLTDRSYYRITNERVQRHQG